MAPPPRLYCILAAKAPVALVFRRGPTDWFHLMLWRLDGSAPEPGVWVRKKLFPERCDFSEDGRFLLYYLAGAFERYRVFAGISWPPWLHPLYAWDEINTWGRGMCFADATTPHTHGGLTTAVVGGCQIAFQMNANISFVNERRRGWVEASDCPPREPDDVWDEKRTVILQRPGADGSVLRLIADRHTIAYGPCRDSYSPRFELRLASGETMPLADAVWSDWDHQGRLLLATSSGELRIDELGRGRTTTIFKHDLSGDAPDPRPAPPWAR